MADPRPLGTIQVDVDELWVYYESIGQSVPEDAPSPVYEQGIPRLMSLFDRFGIRATFFVCGSDLDRHAGALAAMAARGHEIANHSDVHRGGFARLSVAEKHRDIGAVQEKVRAITGSQPVGFKSPGFSFSPDLLDVLSGMGFLYDSSLLPTPYAPLLRTLQRFLSHGHVDPTHYGRPVHGVAPLHPYHPDPQRPHRAGRGTLWEVPVTTMPLLRIPMHSTFVMSAGRGLFDVGLQLVQRRCRTINYLLHAADVVDSGGSSVLKSYRFLSQTWEQKQPLYEHMLSALSRAYRLVPTRELVESLAREK